MAAEPPYKLAVALGEYPEREDQQDCASLLFCYVTVASHSSPVSRGLMAPIYRWGRGAGEGGHRGALAGDGGTGARHQAWTVWIPVPGDVPQTPQK